MQDVRLGSFRCTEFLGSGGMATVWRGVYEGPGAERLPEAHRARVALKVLTSERARQQDWLDAFASEVRAVARLDHRHILAVYDFGEVSEDAARLSQGHFVTGSPWLAMELAEHDALGVRCKGMLWSALRGVILHLMEALAHAHGNGLVHRDLKPGNILFGGDGDILKLADFGLVVDAHGDGHNAFEDYVVGTPNYMAPEQFAGQVSEYGPWTDLYALGSMVFRLVCGRPPYAPRGFRALHEAHCTWPVPSLEPTIGVPPGLDRWVKTLMAKDPYCRFLSVAAARAALLSLGPAEDWGAVESVGEGVTTTSKWPVLSSVALPLVPAVAEVWPSCALPETWCGTNSSRRWGFRGVGLGLYGVRVLPLTGRESERDTVWDVLRQVCQTGEPSAVLLDGPAGVGKSRLARWLGLRAHELGGIEVQLGQHGLDARDGMGALLSRALGIAGCGPQMAQDRLLARWSDVLDEGGAKTLAHVLVGEGAQSEGERRGLWRVALEVLSSTRPMVLVLEDVVWGLETLQFVRWVLDQSPVPVLFVMTARSEDVAADPEVLAAVSACVSHAQCHRVTVGPLGAADSAKLVGQGLGLRGDLAARVQERTGGNPLFAVQLVGDWVARGVLLPDAEGFHLAPNVQVQFPDDLHAIWSTRLQALLAPRLPSEVEALELAAVLGHVVDSVEWRVVCEASAVDPGGILELLLDHGLAQQDPSAVVWSFAHGMAREALLRRCREAGRWQRRHEACASLFKNQNHQPARLGRHLLEAGRPQEALAPLYRGIEQHLVRGALAQAQVLVSLQHRALDGAPKEDPERWRAALQQVRLARLAGRIHGAEQALVMAERLAADFNDPLALAQVSLEVARVAYRAGRLDEVIDAATRGESLAARVHAVLLMARCREVRARAWTDQARFDVAAEGYSQAREAFASEGDINGVASCDLGLGWVALSQHQLEPALTRIRQALEVLMGLGARSSIATAHNLLGEVTRALGQPETSAEHYRQALTLHQACGSQGGATIAQLNLAIVLVEGEAYEEAYQSVETVMGAMVTQGLEQFLGAAELICLVCEGAKGHWETWLQRFEIVEERLASSGQVHGDLLLLAEAAAALASKHERPNEARRAQALAQRQRDAMGSR